MSFLACYQEDSLLYFYGFLKSYRSSFLPLEVWLVLLYLIYTFFNSGYLVDGINVVSVIVLISFGRIFSYFHSGKIL